LEGSLGELFEALINILWSFIVFSISYISFRGYKILHTPTFLRLSLAFFFLGWSFALVGITIFNEIGFKVIVVTNQSGVARGYFPESLVIELHKTLQAKMEEKGAKIDAIYFCPHHPKEGIGKYKNDCNCRKPKPGMVMKAVEEHKVDLEKSYMIGDRYKDILFAKKLKIKSCFVLTGYGRGEYIYDRNKWKVEPEIVGENLLDVARQIESDIKNIPL